MTETLTANASIQIKSDKDALWDALTNPDKIKIYFFGTNTISTWKKGSSIRFTGEWEGDTYEDKRTILDAQPGQLLRYTYRSSMGKLADKPENYSIVTYELVQTGNETVVTVAREHMPSQKSKEHAEKGWQYMLGELKKFAET